MTVSVLPREMNADILSGGFIPSRFFNWPQEEPENEKIKVATKRFTDEDIEPLFTFLQSRNCKIRNKEEITNFLNNHVSIVDYLYEAPEIIKKKFSEVNLNLELCFDPEIEGDEGELFLNIETNLSPKQAVQKLDIIDENWLLKRAGEDIGKFNLNLEFI